MAERPPVTIRATLRDSDDARALVRRILLDFPFAATDQGDEESMTKDFGLALDENGRTGCTVSTPRPPEDGA